MVGDRLLAKVALFVEGDPNSDEAKEILAETKIGTEWITTGGKAYNKGNLKK